MVEVFADPEAVTIAAAQRFVDAARTAVRERGRVTVALAGGSTPRGLYRRLATEPYRSLVDWTVVLVFWGDERCVPPDSPLSNCRMARENLLDRVPIPAANVYRIRGEAEPGAAAREYELLLRELFEQPEGKPPSGGGFDLVLLGLGTDGHTASLFPGSTALTESERWAMAVPGPDGPPWRVTLTPPVIRAAREVIFLVTGSEKAPAFHRAFEPGGHLRTEPATVVLPAEGSVLWLVDSAAAAGPRGGRSESA